MTEPTKPLYTPALGSQAAIGMAHIRAMHPAPVSGSDLAELLHCDSKNVLQAMRRCVDYGLLQIEKVGVRNLYTLTEKEALRGPDPAEVSAEQLQAYAKRAVIMLRGQTKSSVDLAAWCNTTPAIVDKALADQVNAGHLVRVDVLRGGQKMFDYRWGATYVPKDADFDSVGCGQAPEPRVQPVENKALPPKPKKAPGTPTNPASPWRKESTLHRPGSEDLKPRMIMGHPGPELHPVDAVASGADMGRVTPATEEPAQTITPEVKATADAIPTVKAREMGEALLGWIPQLDAPAQYHDEPEPEFSITNRGELTILTVTGDIELEARHALALKRFLDNTSVLEELATGGAL